MAGPDVASFHGLIGRSAPMQALYRRIERVAPFDVPVLIRGESGTGKELVARAIWQLSARRERRFEAINAGALNRELLLSELFGYERGAFTWALVRKAGLLTVVDGGTLFLDEIGDLPLDAQVMLLRFLQDGEIRPVGSTGTRRVDVRIVAPTHRILSRRSSGGRFGRIFTIGCGALCWRCRAAGAVGGHSRLGRALLRAGGAAAWHRYAWCHAGRAQGDAAPVVARERA